MAKTILNIKAKYNTLGHTDKKIADFLMNNPRAVLSMFITEFAKRCDTSEAAIVRFSKKMGFSGYQQLKLSLAQEADMRPVSENITENDSAYDIFSKVCEDIFCSLEKTKRALEAKSLQTCCEKILSADKILICGLGNSASVATDAAHKMLRLGLNACAYTDNHMQAIAAAHTTNNSVFLGISHSGRSKDVVEAMKIAREQGAFCTALTGAEKSPLHKAADVVLRTVSDETNYRILGLSSRIAQLAIIDAVYSYLVCHLPLAENKIAATEAALQNKKI
ncbi:MAG: MurR/RpiR family transcriptional regulator [Candidatus Borkfalkiaceae bacterium]|nr:MurR/RpiR family transcriptional regulator [Clostridia bacterium]MDY6223675.1 MurR/RpiR family transcriptional regulator [Christensenellaceae bacterium]